MLKNMSSRVSRYALTSLAISSFIFSCSKEDPEVVDTTKPTVSFVGLQDNSTVEGTVTVEVQATDDKAVTKVEIFVDGVSVGTYATAPYKIQWDTEKLEDGEHVLKAIATDESGNSQTFEITVVVDNHVLITIDVPSNYYATTDVNIEKTWIVVHDKNWNLLASGEVQNGVPLKLIGPSTFSKDETFTVSEIHFYDSFYKFTNCVSFLDVEKGKWTLATGSYYSNEEAKLTFNNVVTDYIVSTNAGTSYWGYDFIHSSYYKNIYLDLSKSPSKLYVSHNPSYNENPKYILLDPALSNKGDYSIDMSKLDNAPASNNLFKEAFIVPEGDHYINLYGLPVANDITETYYLGSARYDDLTGQYMLYYPPVSSKTFAQHFSRTSSYYSSSRVVNYSFDNYNFAKFPVQVSVTETSGNSRLYTATGGFDYFKSQFSNDDTYDRWLFMGPNITNRLIKIPELPQNIKSAITYDGLAASVDEQYISFIDAKSTKDYKEWITTVRAGRKGLLNFNIDLERTEIFPDIKDGVGSSGRKKIIEKTLGDRDKGPAPKRNK